VVQEVSGLFQGDVGPEVAGLEEPAGVGGNPLQADGADLVKESGDLGVTGGGVTRSVRIGATRGAISVIKARTGDRNPFAAGDSSVNMVAIGTVR